MHLLMHFYAEIYLNHVEYEFERYGVLHIFFVLNILKSICDRLKYYYYST